jgi:hypothetical protein
VRWAPDSDDRGSAALDPATAVDETP